MDLGENHGKTQKSSVVVAKLMAKLKGKVLLAKLRAKLKGKVFLTKLNFLVAKLLAEPQDTWYNHKTAIFLGMLRSGHRWHS